MLKGLAHYSSITAKVRAMYGQRLRGADWDNLASEKSLPGVISYLLKCPGWQEAAAGVVTKTNRGALEEALRKQLLQEYVKLYKFASFDDKRYFLFTVYKFEYEIILRTLRGLMSAARVHAMPDFLEFHLQKTRVQVDMLMEADSWRDILAAVRDSIYYEPLIRIPTDPHIGLPDYTAVSVLLRSTYFTTLSRFLRKQYSGDVKKLVLSALGHETDLLNLTHIMRLRQYFPDSPQLEPGLLLPIHHKLRPAFFSALIGAPGQDEAIKLIQSSYYGRYFETYDYQYIDQYYVRVLYDFNRKHLIYAIPSPYIVTAYMALKEHEMRRLFGVIERIHYSVNDRIDII